MTSRTILPSGQGARLLYRVCVSSVLPLLLLAGCGGGGGGNSGGGGINGGQSLELTPTSISVSASTADPAPTALATVTIGNALIGVEYYVAATTTNSGVASVNVGSEGSSSVQATGGVTINFKPPGSLALGKYTDTVTVRGCYDQACTQLMSNSPQTVSVQYTVTNPLPAVTSLSPSTVSVGAAAFSLTVYGTEFTSASVVNWNGTATPTTFVSSTQLTAQISAADVATAGNIPVTVTIPGIATSNAAMFAVNPVVAGSVAPNLVAVGGPGFTLNVFGSGFSASSVVEWNGSGRTTTFISATQVQARIQAADITTAGTASINVLTPDGNAGISATIPVTIAALPSWPAAADAVAYQINPGHTGAVTFSSVTFPTNITWTVDLGATVSYPLIAAGKVFVATTSSSGSNLYALDRTTGGTVWGPVAVAGTASLAYDNGTLFVSSGVGSGSGAVGSVEAFDPTTGVLRWSTPMNGFDSISTSGPAALNGYVYVTGGGSSGIGGIFALAESNGVVSWTQSNGAAADSIPAVGPNGVYADFACGLGGFNPTTGQSLWAQSGTCSGGAGATAYLVGNTVFTPSSPSIYSGNIVNATTGVSTGTYTASIPPVFDSQNEYAVQTPTGTLGNIQAIQLGSGTVKWTFTGDDICSAAVISQYVIAEGCDGKLFGLNATDGTQAWTADPGAPTIWNFGPEAPLQSLAAGEGVLVVPAGTKLVTYTLATAP